ncbi:hypothetical protein BJY16_005265 [Actinoplanes octamycinicus]|uniref:CHAT domain-containing protein n=1 Tax=Actinoplanes octamycinicus TaxID=135948 RepID=A0A7W7H0N8_9ACTN|nr:CHAT domain-containing protein [Actinoplanes octamycinicus]MBB4741806.1 hypothetical protein [Actinoplanes octamycinicus]GIE57364.1 hypothetical protein Aoc01nite_27660 [Actinoplanes octamycinicus]
MEEQELAIEVRADGTITATTPADNRRQRERLSPFTGPDAELIKLFERWIARRDHVWQDRDLRAFGSLLHRYLFPGTMWSWVENRLPGLPHPARVALIFPPDPPFARLAAVPWEYLHRPGNDGYYLATDSRLVLSRYLRRAATRADLTPVDRPRIQIVVSRPKTSQLKDVVFDDVEEAVRATEQHGFAVLETLHDPGVDQLFRAIEERQPHVVHYMGHGEFRQEQAEGRLALVDSYGDVDWVSDRELAEHMRRLSRVPRMLVLHSCDGARADFTESFAGLAPQLLRSGLHCVIAMQYAVTNSTATAFSVELYRQLAARVPPDRAVQAARMHIGGRTGADPRLLGIPVTYLHGRPERLFPEEA